MIVTLTPAPCGTCGRPWPQHEFWCEVYRDGRAPVVPSAPASGPTPETPATTRELKTPGPGADPMAPLRTFATRGARAQAAIDRLLVRPAPATMDPIPFAQLRAQADLLLALYLLEHPTARPTQISAIELIAWSATKQ